MLPTPTVRPAFRPLPTDQRDRLLNALRANAERGEPLRMDPRDTTFVDADDAPTDEAVISVIKSVPCHYAG